MNKTIEHPKTELEQMLKSLMDFVKDDIQDCGCLCYECGETDPKNFYLDDDGVNEFLICRSCDAGDKEGKPVNLQNTLEGMIYSIQEKLSQIEAEAEQRGAEKERERLRIGREHTVNENSKRILKRDEKVFSIITNYWKEFGSSPSFRTIARIYGCTSRNIEVSVQKLRELGYLKNQPKIAISPQSDSSTESEEK